jgi:ketosteroid isomerase-like protein
VSAAELLEGIFVAWDSGDMDALSELFDPDIVARSPEGWPEPGPFVGRDAVLLEFQRLRETWKADRLEPIGEFEGRGDRAVVRYRWHGSGAGPDMTLELSLVATARNDRIILLEYFWDHAQGRTAAGL